MISIYEKEILKLAVEGRTNGEIAEILHISKNTVKTCLNNLFKRTNTHNRVQLAINSVIFERVPDNECL